MIESVLSSNHHFYLLFFESPKVKNLGTAIDLFSVNKKFRIISTKRKSFEYCHLQLEIDTLYGSEGILQMNISKTKKTGTYYWYDFYLGRIDIAGKKYFYICYLYNKMSKFLEKQFSLKNVNIVYYKPEIEAILNYMKNQGKNEISTIEANGFLANITRYSGQVKDDEDKANKVNIIGKNPLKSKTYEILSTAKGINIETISLKLKCQQLNIGEIELSFDRIGNYRFWLKYLGQEQAIPVIPYAFQFLMEISPLKESTYISTNTLLENE